jgi:hypothetical protein
MPYRLAVKPPVRSLAWASACGCGRSSRAARREWSSARTLAAGNEARRRSIVVLIGFKRKAAPDGPGSVGRSEGDAGGR